MIEEQTQDTALNLKMGAAAAMVRPETVQGQLLFLENEQVVFGYQSSRGVELWKYLSAQTLRQAFSRLPVDSGWLPPGLVRWGIREGMEWAVLFNSPGRHILSILEGAEDQERRVSLPLPGLVFAGSRSDYFVWAVKEKSFSPTNRLYLAPLPNLGGNGLVCFGSNQVPEVTTGAITGAWQLFIGTPFNGHQANAKCRRYPEDVRPLLLGLVGRAKFPVRELIPYSDQRGNPVTVAGAVEKLLFKEG